MALALTITSVTARNGVVSISGRIVASSNYATGGDTADFTKATQDAKFSGILAMIASSQPPSTFDVWTEGGNVTRSYAAVIGTAQNNCKVKFGGSTYASELAAGAYPSDVTGDTIGFYAEFPSLN